MLGIEIVPDVPKFDDGPLSMTKSNWFDICMAYLAKSYVNTMNVIHYMHDKYYYERVQMAYGHPGPPNMAFGLAAKCGG